MRTGLFTSPLALCYDLPQPSLIIRNIKARVAHLAALYILGTGRRKKGQKGSERAKVHTNVNAVKGVFTSLQSGNGGVYFQL